MKKVLLIATVMAFASTGFASSAFAGSCDPVSNAKACKIVVHHKAPKAVKKTTAPVCKLKNKKKCPKK